MLEDLLNTNSPESQAELIALAHQFREIQKAAQQELTEESSSVARAIKAIHVAETCWSQIQEQVETPVLACKTGCSYCCYLEVKISQPEIDLIVYGLIRDHDRDQLRQIQQHANAIYRMAQGLTVEDRVAAHIPCSMLDTHTGLCSVYRYRPLGCRGFNSVDVKACEREWNSPTELGIPVVRRKLVAYEAVLDVLSEGELVDLNWGVSEGLKSYLSVVMG